MSITYSVYVEKHLEKSSPHCERGYPWGLELMAVCARNRNRCYCCPALISWALSCSRPRLQFLLAGTHATPHRTVSLGHRSVLGLPRESARWSEALAPPHPRGQPSANEEWGGGMNTSASSPSGRTTVRRVLYHGVAHFFCVAS